MLPLLGLHPQARRGYPPGVHSPTRFSKTVTCESKMPRCRRFELLLCVDQIAS